MMLSPMDGAPSTALELDAFFENGLGEDEEGEEEEHLIGGSMDSVESLAKGSIDSKRSGKSGNGTLLPSLHTFYDTLLPPYPFLHNLYPILTILFFPTPSLLYIYQINLVDLVSQEKEEKMLMVELV